MLNNDADSAITGKPLIAIYGIYKNEQTFIERFLNSAEPADEIVLCDTGSTDDTNKMISEFINSHPNCNLKTFSIYISPWRFDDARNAALSLVSPGIDLCLSLDIDEYLANNWKEQLTSQWEEGITRYYHKYKTFWPDGSVTGHWHERIHARKGYTWELPVHEILEYKGSERVKRLPDFWIYQRPEKKDSRNSYLPLLEQSVKERKDIWKSWSFLANEYLSLARYDDALGAVDTALKIADSDKTFLYRQKYLIYKAQGRMEMALLSLDTALLTMPERRELYVEKAKLLSRLGRNTEAYFAVLDAEKRTDRIIDYHFNPSAWDKGFDDLKSKIFRQARGEGILL